MSTAKDIVSQGIDSAAERYADATVVRAAITAVPWIGGPIDAVLSTRAGKLQNRRLHILIDALTEQVRLLSEETVGRDAFASDEWVDSVVAALTAAARTRDAEQIKVYAKLLVAGVCTGTEELPEIATLIAVLAELTPHEIVLARLFADMPGSLRYDEHRQARRVVEDDSWKYVLENLPDSVKPNLMFHLKRLERAGLISELTGTYGGSTGRYEPTPTLWRVVDALRRGDTGTDHEPGST